MKKPVSLLLALLMCLTLCACGEDSGIKESRILSDIPEQFITVDGQLLNYDSIDVSKRNTKEGVDSIYFSLSASNDNYEVTAQCHFKYNYYSEGGWILDYAEIVNGKYTVIPLNECSRDYPEEYMQYYYMDYQLVSSDLGEDGGVYYTEYTYEGTNEWTYYSQTVSMHFLYTFETELEVREDSENIYCNDIFTDWKSTGGDREIISDEWDLDLNMHVEPRFESIWFNIERDEEAKGSLLYSGIVVSFGDKYEGSGTKTYGIDCRDLYDPYIHFEVTLYYVLEDGSLDYDRTENLYVKIRKDYVSVSTDESNWYKVKVE